MTEQILILDGHPDPAHERLVHALALAYKEGAEQGGHRVHYTRLADLDFPVLRSPDDYAKEKPVAQIQSFQSTIEWATHIVILYPLWLGAMPALLKALLEQTLRPGFAFSTPTLGHAPLKLLQGKTARIVVTMGMPALLYRWYFRAHTLRNLQRNILGFVGFRRIRTTVIGSVGNLRSSRAAGLLEDMRALGRAAS
jgi:putative NADPH-quinone reductase